MDKLDILKNLERGASNYSEKENTSNTKSIRIPSSRKSRRPDGEHEMGKLDEISRKYTDGERQEQEIREKIKELSPGKIPEEQKEIIGYLLSRLDEVEVSIETISFDFAHFVKGSRFYLKPKK